ncbi:hypothetical protein SAMN05216360_11270 [Methylobacterium phyllostachyos]|uniref:Uncharacterized protein n=1 Tax=Methylobacterium phyllostachyos TaxID=582672 RepID=A0A1H0F023_9HYPH|nr:hypothetical protein [Methylobacterium phyllostachyos]SDN87899.1 hypothetical protein SAMN05216360_11270 [Methylobacterium phyllostachyos]
MRLPILRIALAVTALTGPVLAQPLTAGTAESSCGGDAFSSAQIVEHRRGPLVAMPDTLCADLAPQPGTPTTQIDVYPLVTPQGGPVGPGGGGIPYGGRSMRPYRP